MSKVYVITQGEYSDCQVVGVALDKEQAERIRLVRSTYSDPAFIDEYDTEEIEVAKDFESYWLVPFDKDNVKEDDIYPFTGDAPYKINEWGYKQYNIIVKAKDKRHAIKVAIDTLAKYKALKVETELSINKLNEFLREVDDE